MEESRFWTKTKLIILFVFLAIIGIVVGIIFLNRAKLKKDYIKLENQITNQAAPNYMLIEQIDLDWILRNVYEWELIFRAIGADKNEISEEYKINENSCWTYWRTPDEEVWQTWVNNNQGKLSDLYGKYYVEIEDHFEDAWEITEEAYGDSIASESRH